MKDQQLILEGLENDTMKTLNSLVYTPSQIKGAMYSIFQNVRNTNFSKRNITNIVQNSKIYNIYFNPGIKNSNKIELHWGQNPLTCLLLLLLYHT